jgi:hypothetical protein
MKSCCKFAALKPLTLVLVCTLVFAMAVSGFATTQSTSSAPKVPTNFYRLAGPQMVVPMPVNVVDPNPAAVRLHYGNPPLEIGTVTIGGVEYETVRLSGEGSTVEPGIPDLPRVHRMVMISNTGNVDLSIVNQHYNVVQNLHPVSPVQPLEGENPGVLDAITSPDGSIYNADAWYPPAVVQISEPATLRDVRFVVISVSPVQINPVTGEMRVYDDLEVEVANAGGVGANEIAITPTAIDPDWKRLYSSFENFTNSSLDEIPVVPGDYIIICPPTANVVTEANRMVNWKKRRGLNAKVYTTDSTGTSASSIKNFIYNKYVASGGQLAYVCLMGDPNGAAGYVLTTGASSQLDNYFGTLNSGGPNPDPVPDIAVGRMSCGSASVLNATNVKTINYESNPYTTNTAWFTQTWCAAGTAYVPSNISTKSFTRAIMLQHGVTNSFWDPNTISSATVNSRLTSGISVFNYRMSWIGEMSNSTVDAGVINTQMLPFVMVITCGTGNFDGDALSEAWLRPSGQTNTTPMGAIGAVGLYGSSTHVPYNNILDAGTMYGLYALDIQTQGAALVAGKLELYRNYWTSEPSQVQNFCYWANLMGDPSVPIWRHRPVVANVTRPASINRGTNNVAVTVTNSETTSPVPGALVCLLKGTETFKVGYTDGLGQINLPCSTATTGYMQITITKDDLKPYVDSIQVVSATASLALSSVFVDDTTNATGTIGNSNHVVNPGETIDLYLYLTNTGSSTTVTGITGTLTTTTPGVQILQGTSAYPNIATAAIAGPTTLYRIRTSTIYDLDNIVLFLATSSSVGNQTIRMDLAPRTPNVTYVSSLFGGPGGDYNQGEDGDLTVTFRNSGSTAYTAGQGILRSLDPMIVVSDSLGTFGSVAAGATGSNSTDRFHISVGNAFNGHRAVMQLVMTDPSTGFRDSTVFDSAHFFTTDTSLFDPNPANFSLAIGTRDTMSPTGPDAAGYFAYDSHEVPSSTAATYQWVEIAPGQGGSGTSLGFTDTAEDGDESSALHLPFNFRFYNHTFDSITVCTNGWLSFGRSMQTDFRNYRMASPLGPPYQVCPYWDDLQMTGTNNVFYYYDAANHWYVVEWRAQTLWSPYAIEIFEVILYDPAYYPSASGNGKIKFQYLDINPVANSTSNDNLWASIGIQNGDHSAGLDYGYWNSYTPGSSPIHDGLAIMFSTDASGQLNPSITVTQPRGGESWYLGQSYNVQWQSTAITGNVNVEMKRNYPSGTWESLFANTNNDGVQSWTANTPLAAGTARIRVVSVTNSAVADTSFPFSIVTPTVTLTTPNGGEILTTGSTYSIQWTDNNLGAARVELNRNYPLGTWETLATQALGTLDWIVSGNPTTSARIRVTGITVPTVGDTSNANFTIGIPPVISHDPHGDQAPGNIVFTAKVTDDAFGFVTKLFYHIVGAGVYDSATFSATGNPDEYSATIALSGTGRYEYYLRSSDPQSFTSYLPAAGTYKFDLGIIGSNYTTLDDGVAENNNWVDGPGYKWAVKFEPTSYPYVVTGAKFAVCPTAPHSSHLPIIFQVISADGIGGMPGSILFTDTTGSAGNVVGGLPAGAAWTDVVLRTGGQPITVNSPFYLSVQNAEPRVYPSAFSTDTSGTRNHKSYFWDECLGQWFNEDLATPNARPGNRMIRAAGFPLGALNVVAFRQDSSVVLTWTSNGAPYYHIYTDTNVGGAFSTLVNSVAGPAAGQVVQYIDLGVVNQAQLKRFYRVYGSDQP